MNIYFAASTANLDTNRTHFDSILKTFKDLNHEILDSWIVEALKDSVSELTPKELILKNAQLLQESDLVVIDLSTRSFGVGYQFGQALAHRKHVLCLYHEKIEHKVSDIIKGSTSSLVTIKTYKDNNINKVVRDYLAGLTMDDLRKFNFIATEEIVRYIEDGAETQGKSKSEFLRDLLLKEIIHK